MDISEEILIKYSEVFNNLRDKGKGKLKFGHNIVRIRELKGYFSLLHYLTSCFLCNVTLTYRDRKNNA